MPYWADCITDTPESRFPVHTGDTALLTPPPVFAQDPGRVYRRCARFGRHAAIRTEQAPTLRRFHYRPLPDFLAPSAERVSSSILMRDSAAANACSASESAGFTT